MYKYDFGNHNICKVLELNETYNIQDIKEHT